jgi:hypothetical protein
MTVQQSSSSLRLYLFPILVQREYLTPPYIEQPLSPMSPNHQKDQTVHLIACGHDDASELRCGDY